MTALLFLTVLILVLMRWQNGGDSLGLIEEKRVGATVRRTMGMLKAPINIPFSPRHLGD